MTTEQPHPEQEYIITEEELSRLAEQAGADEDCDPSEVCGHVRSRPHLISLLTQHHNPGFFAYNEKCDCSVCHDIREAHDEKIRRDATEKVLDEVRKTIGDGLPDTEHTLGRIIDYLQEKGR